MGVLENVAYLLKEFPEMKADPNMLVLLYWKFFDEIDIPDGVSKQILKLGTPPETILRYKRMALKESKRFVSEDEEN